MASLLNDFLEALEVPHTRRYADNDFASMPFSSLFGFSRKLKAYGVESVAAQWDDKSVLPSIPVPFLAQLRSGFVIVRGFGEDGSVDFRSATRPDVTLPASEFERQWTGVALLAYPDSHSAEPSLARHRFMDFVMEAKRWLLVICLAIVAVAGIVSSGLWRSPATIALLIVDFAGLAVTWLLILKTLKVKSRSADRICGVLQEHGCDHVLEQKASTFFGIVSWSEVGFSYFAVSLVALLLFPGAIGWLALINVCCLPFTFWSIWYQKFKIRTWCTLCVTTQALLWLQAGSYLWSGAWHTAFPLGAGIITLIASYGAALLGLNRLMTFIKRIGKTTDNEPSTPSNPAQ